MKSSTELLREQKRDVWWTVGILVVAAVLKKFGLASIPDSGVGWYILIAMIILGLWLIQCTETIIAAIREEAGRK